MRIGIYEVIELLGDGGMGSVYRCRDPRFDRQVALKVLHPHFQRNPDVIVRFKTEAVVQAKLSHPNIVTVYDFLADDSGLAIVMELVEGESAERLVETRGPLSIGRGLRLFEQVLGAIGYAHEKGLVHRDLKPSNLLIQRADDQEIAKVVDFGIAKIVGSDRQKTATSAKLGTLAYMSPEQVRSPRAVDLRSDIYSLGASLQQLLTGGLPFDGESDYEVMRAILEADPTPPSIEGQPLPARVDRAIRKALLRDPDQRFQSCGEFLDALRGGEVELPITPPPPPLPTEPQPPPPQVPGPDGTPRAQSGTTDSPSPRRWLRGLAAALLGVLLLGGGAAGWIVYRGFEHRAIQAEAEAKLAEERAEAEALRLREEAAAKERQRRLQEERERREEEREQERQEKERRRAEERERDRREEQQRRLARAREALETAIREASTELGRGELEAARLRLQTERDAVPRDLRADLDDQLESVQEHLLEIDQKILALEAEARTEEAMAAARRRVFEDQLSLAREHLNARRYPEAKSVTEQVLEEPDLPSDLRAQAQDLVEFARNGLRGDWKGAGVGEPVERKRKPPDP